jgi:hypothetical protein
MQEHQEIVGQGELWCGQHGVLTGVHYRLFVSADGTATGVITAPASARLGPFVSAAADCRLLRLSNARFVTFDVRVYERKAGGTAQISGYLLRASTRIASAAA